MNEQAREDIFAALVPFDDYYPNSRGRKMQSEGFQDVLRKELEAEVSNVPIGHPMRPQNFRDGPSKQDCGKLRAVGETRTGLRQRLSDKPQTVLDLIEGSDLSAKAAHANLVRMENVGEARRVGFTAGNTVLWVSGNSDTPAAPDYLNLLRKIMTTKWQTADDLLAKLRKEHPETSYDQVASRLRKMQKKSEVKRMKKLHNKAQRVFWRLA